MPMKTLSARKISKEGVFAAIPVVLLAILLFGCALLIPFLWLKVNKLQTQVTSLGSLVTTMEASYSFTSTAANKPVPPVTASDHILGNPSAKVVIVEYADLECPFCKEFSPVLQEAEQSFGGQVALVYRTYPLSFHQNAEKEAEAQECAAAQGGNNAFWKYTDAIFTQTTSNGTGFALDALAPLAGQQGLNETTFATCLNSGMYASKVSQTEAAGSAAGVAGTPTSFVIKHGAVVQTIPGALPYDQVKTILQTALTSGKA